MRTLIVLIAASMIALFTGTAHIGLYALPAAFVGDTEAVIAPATGAGAGDRLDERLVVPATSTTLPREVSFPHVKQPEPVRPAVAPKRASDARMRAPSARQPAPARSATGGGAGGDLAKIRACESGGNYSAVSPSGQYRGAYQFDRQTWASVGGSGDPAAAPPAEQDARAAQLKASRGNSPWPVCGR